MSECIVWARHGSAVFSYAWYIGAPSLRTLSRTLGTRRGAFTGLNPLPPFGRVYVVEPWPFSCDERGVVAFRSFAFAHEPRAEQSGAYFAWSDVRAVDADDARVLVNGAPFAVCSSARHARAAARVLDELRRAAGSGVGSGDALAQLVRAHLDPAPVAAAVERHARWGLPSLALAAGAFACVFVLVPRVVVADGLARWPLLVASVYAWVVPCALALYVGHRALLPAREDVGARVAYALTMLPAPTMAIRGNDKLGRHLLAGAHPFAAALALLDGADRARAVGAALRDLAHPRALPALGDDGARTESAFRARLLTHARALATDHGVDVDAAFAPPAGALAPPALSAWCSRCRAVYRNAPRDGDGRGGGDDRDSRALCADCGIALERATSASASAPASASGARGAP